MTNKNDIKSMGITIFDYFKKNKTYPKSVKIKGIDYTIQEATYLMASFIATPKDDIPKMSVKGASSPTGDRCNRKVNKNTYQDMSKRLVQYIKQNGKLPNYVTIDGKQRCSIILFMLQLSKIMNAYDGAFPSAILINSHDLEKQQTHKKYGHATRQGCDNMGQNTPYYCGVHSLQEVFRNLTNILVPQSTIAGWAGTTSAGTSHYGLETAVAQFNKKYNQKLIVKWYNFSDLGWNGIKKIITSNNQDVIIHNLYRNKDGHYEVINNINGSNVEVQNSLGSTCGSCYCGYHEYRSTGEFQSYINGISQKSLMVITNDK